ncbi:MAG: hypothetical protein ACLFPL_04280 [Candidatus Nanoarchaeia archaeon]
MKFRKATKKIVAVASATALASASVFGAANYPSNFVEDGELIADVVVGSGAAASDTTAAQSIVDDLQDRYSEGASTTTITYRDSSSGGESVSATDERDTLNFGTDNFSDIREELDLDMTSILEDRDLDTEEYSQELMMGETAEFNYRLFDEVDKEEATDGLYFGNGATFATYVLEFDTALDSDSAPSSGDSDMIGEELTIMDNEFTVVDLFDNSMTLIGGANKFAMGEGDTNTVTVDGESYEVEVLSVSDDTVLVSVNGETQSVDEFDVETIGGVSVAATDLVASSRDSVQGYAELVVGGQKVEIEDTSNVKINDEDLDDIYPEYEVEAVWDGQELRIDYMIDDEVLLERGDSLEDVLFDAFTLSYEGINDVDYSELIITSDSDSIDFNGNLYNGNSIPSEFMISVNDESEDANDIFQLGADDERIFFSGSQLLNATNETAESGDVINNLDNTIEGLTSINDDEGLRFDLNDEDLDIDDQLFFTQETDPEDMHLFQVMSTRDDDEDSTISFEDLIGDSTYDDRNAEDVRDDLESDAFDNTDEVINVTLEDLSEDTGEEGERDAQLYLENEMIMNFENAENKTGGGHNVTFSYSSDADADDEPSTLENVITLSYFQVDGDADTDPIELIVNGLVDEVAGDRFEVEEDSDLEMFLDRYGTRVTIDTDENDMVMIEVPDEEVYGTVNFNFGSVGETMTETVPTSQADDRVEELEDDGFTVVSTDEETTEDVEVNVTGPTLDVDADVEAGNHIVVGGPAVNAAARIYLEIDEYSIDQAGVEEGEFVHLYYEDANSILVYGYSAEDTEAAVEELNAGQADFEEE